MHNFGPNYFPASYFSKVILFGNVDQNCSSLTIVSHHALSFQKNCHKADQENKVFALIATYLKKEFFLKIDKYDWCLTISPDHARMLLKISRAVDLI